VENPSKVKGKKPRAPAGNFSLFLGGYRSQEIYNRDRYLLRLTKIFIEVKRPSLPATGLRFARQLGRLLQNLDHKLNTTYILIAYFLHFILGFPTRVKHVYDTSNSKNQTTQKVVKVTHTTLIRFFEKEGISPKRQGHI
jgi:hypothetical protein